MVTRLTVFFFPYALLEVPCNMVLKVLRPSIWIGAMMLSWGTVMTLVGIVKDFDGLVGARTAVRCNYDYIPELYHYYINTLAAWSRRSRLLPSKYIFPNNLVPTTRAAESDGRLLQCRLVLRCVFRSPRIRPAENGGNWRFRRMAMDFYCRGPSNCCCWRDLLLAAS